MPDYVLKRKNGTRSVLNGSIVGPLIYDGISNIRGANTGYFRLPQSYPLFNADSWEFRLNVSNVQQGGGTAVVVGGENNFGFFVLASYKYLGIYLSSNDTSWDIANNVNTQMPYAIGESYYYKIGYDGTQYYAEYNTDGSDTYIRTWTLVSDKRITGSGLGTLLGYAYIINNFWANASIDLTKCSLAVNGEVVWTGMKQVPEHESFTLMRKKTGLPVYEDYTLPVMTSDTAPEGQVSSNLGGGDYTNSPYNFWFGGTWYFEAAGKQGWKYNNYTFVRPLKPDTYTLSFQGNLQSRDTNYGTVSVGYDDGTAEEILSYTLSTASQTFSQTFTATKPISSIRFDMHVDTSSSQNDVTAFANLNIVSTTGNLQIVVSPDTSKIGNYSLCRILYKDILIINKIGNPSVDGFSVSGFSANDYVTIPVSIPTYGYELVFGMQTGSDVATQQAILGNTSADNSFMLSIKNGLFTLIDKYSGVSENEASGISTGGTVSPNVSYWLKLINTGSASGSITTLYYSTDNGATFIPACAIRQDLPWLNPCPFGQPSSRDSVKAAFAGSIDFTNAYLKSDNTVIWTGKKTIKY